MSKTGRPQALKQVKNLAEDLSNVLLKELKDAKAKQQGDTSVLSTEYCNISDFRDFMAWSISDCESSNWRMDIFFNVHIDRVNSTTTISVQLLHGSVEMSAEELTFPSGDKKYEILLHQVRSICYGKEIYDAVQQEV